MQTDPLSFLDEYTESDEFSEKESDPLSFLEESTEFERPSKKITNYRPREEERSSDPLAFLEEPEEPLYDKFTPKPYSKKSPEKSLRQNILDIYTPEEKTPEQLKSMSIEDRMQYAQELQNLRELQSGTGLAKGALSGATLSASEHIPGLKPDEEDLMVGLGETLGSYLPISKLYNFIGKPLVNFASKSPVARKGLEALARMTGFGLTGATYEAGKEFVQGEVPTVEELAKTGATWAAIDGLLQTLGLGVAFQQSVSRIAEQEGVTAKEVLGKLWDSTKNYLKQKFISPKNIGEPEIEVLMQQAKKAESKGLLPETEIEVRPKEEGTKQIEHKPREEIAKPEAKSDTEELSVPENAVLTKPENISIGEHGGKSVATVPVRKTEDGHEYFSHEVLPITKEEKELIGASHVWERAGDNNEASRLAQEAREMIYKRLKGKKTEEIEPTSGQITFTTSKGSTYQVNEDGGTTRTKAVRPEHPGEEGLQPKSEKTWYVTPEDSVKLGEFQTIGENKKIVELPNGQLAVQYLTGKDAGKLERRTLVDFSKEPREGKIPVESWNDGQRIHFGNEITKVERTYPKEIFRGYGREKKESVYAHVQEPILGEGKYYAFSEQEAREFGPKIERKEIDLKNPLVIKNDVEWRAFTTKAGLEFPNPVAMSSKENTIENVRKLRNALEEEGYDGAVIWFPKTSYDVNESGQSIKTIRKVFGAAQVFEMPRKAQPELTKEPEVKPKEKKEPEVKVIDERPILKEIMDLKDELSRTKGTTRTIQQKKKELADSIKEKSKELASARKHNKALEKPILKKVERPDITPKGLKRQKDYILDKIDDAIVNPPDTNQVVIDVPGDGEFKINNEPRILESVRDKVEKDWPVRQLKTKPPAEIRKKGKEEGVELLSARLPEEEAVAEELPKKPTQIPPRQTRPRQPVAGKKQAVARSKIIDLFRTAFTDPIRLGKFRQKAAGIHKLWPKVTRLLKDNDIETVAHEIGHNLHTTLYGGDAKTPQEQAKNIENALRPYLNELKPLAHYEPWGMEGFAEFTRLYVTNPDVALELAPNFYAKFEADLGAQYPEMKNALLEAREYYDAYLQGTPQSRIRAQTNYASDRGKLANIIEAVKKKFHPDKLKTEFLDDVFPAKRLVAEAFGIPLSEVENLKDERNLYRALRVLKGAVGKGDVFVLHETFNAKTLDKINGSLRDILKQLPNEESYREFNDYLIARRALEKTAQNVETGINAGDALAVEQQLRPKYGKLALELDKYNDALLNYAKDAGLLSGKQYVAIKENNVLYTPFQRVMETEKGGMASGSGRIQAGKPIKRMKGSTRDIIAPVESIIKNTYSIIINAEKNLAGQVLAKIAKTKKNVGAYVELVPTPIKLKGKVEGEQVARELAKRFEREGLSDLIEYDQDGKPVLREDIADAIPEVFLRFGAGQYPAGENIVTVYFEGKPVYYEVSPDLFEMWTKSIAPYTAGLLTKILRIPAKTLRAGAILNPKFMMKNIVRDTWGSWLFTKYGKSLKDPKGLFIDTIYSPLAMLATSAGKGKLYVEWMKSGGSMSTMQSVDRDNVVKKLDEVRRGWKSYGVIKWLRQVAEISEEANRLSEFGKALEVEGKTRLGREIAAFAARDLSIDFAKMGLQVKALNQVIPFFNATVQGGDKLLRTMANPEDRKNFLPRVIGFIVLPSLILAWLNKDDENVKEFYEEEKDFNFITQIGGEYIKIPVPFETGVLAHGLTQRMFNYFMKKDPEAFEKFMGSIIEAMMPSFIPTAGLPFFETWANKSFFTGARIIPRSQEDLIAKYQYKNNTSSTARLLGRAMAYMLGQETRSKAASPAIIDHFINTWGAGLGQRMISISDASLEAAGLSDKIPRPGQTITERLGFDAFIARFPRSSTRSIEKFYDNYADATARQKSIKYTEKMDIGTEEEREEAYSRFEKIFDYKSLQAAYKAMQDCQREINNIWNDPVIDEKRKKQFLDGLYLDMIDFAKAANEDIREYRLAQED